MTDDSSGFWSSKPFSAFGVEFAPLKLPIRRRIQTLSVVVNVLMLFGGTATATVLLLVYLSFTSFWWVAALYAAWYFYDLNTDENGGRDYEYCHAARNWSLYRHSADFYPIKMVKTADLDPSKTYILGYHPHGILSFGALSCFATDTRGFPAAFPGLRSRLLTLKMNFYLPGMREVALSSGMCSATKKGMDALLRTDGNLVGLVVGGAPESLNTGDRKSIRLFLEKRRGFVKLALQHGRELVPAFGFGENDIYEQFPNPEGSWVRWFQARMERVLTFTLPLFYGRGIFQYNFGILPHRHPITVVVGRPVSVEKISDPTPDQVSHYHAKYVASLQKLYDEYNPIYGNSSTKLIIA